MTGKARYKVTGIVEGTHEQLVIHFNGAPGDSQIAGRFHNWRPRHRVVMATRYFPSKKAWALIDLRKAFMTSGQHERIRFWQGIKRYPRFLPSEDAAIMVALHLLQSVGAQSELDL